MTGSQHFYQIAFRKTSFSGATMRSASAGANYSYRTGSRHASPRRALVARLESYTSRVTIRPKP
jgi:hypothetical protein